MSDGHLPRSLKYLSLDVLRGVAAVWVFLSHLSIGFPVADLHPAIQAVLQRGYLGVPMFFVISGYCLMASARGSMRHHEPAHHFLYRRALRIYPPFWFSVALVVVLPYLIERVSSLKTGTYVTPLTDFPASVIEWLSVLSLTQVFQSQGKNLHEAFGNVNSVYWTLAIEVQFYLIVALALACGKRWRWVLGSVTGASLICALAGPTYRWGVFLPYWPAFALGLGLHQLLDHGMTPTAILGGRPRRLAAVLLITTVAGICMAFASASFADYGPDAQSIDTFLFALLFAGMLWIGHALDENFAALARSRHLPLAWAARLLFVAGAMSYSIYLLHTKLVYFTMLFVRQVASPGSATFFIGCAVGTVTLCYPFYILGEKPFMRSRVSPRRRVADLEAPAATVNGPAIPHLALPNGALLASERV